MTKTASKTTTRTPRATPKAKPAAKPAKAVVKAPATDESPSTPRALKGKLATVLELISRPDGASSEELQAATGWQAHSVRGAIAGAIKKAGHTVVSERTDAGRRYRISQGAPS